MAKVFVGKATIEAVAPVGPRILVGEVTIEAVTIDSFGTRLFLGEVTVEAVGTGTEIIEPEGGLALPGSVVTVPLALAEGETTNWTITQTGGPDVPVALAADRKSFTFRAPVHDTYSVITYRIDATQSGITAPPKSIRIRTPKAPTLIKTEAGSWAPHAVSAL